MTWIEIWKKKNKAEICHAPSISVCEMPPSSVNTSLYQNKCYSDTVSFQQMISTARRNLLSSLLLSCRVMTKCIKGLKSDEFNWWYHTVWPEPALLLSDGRKRLSTRLFVYALWTAHNEYRGLVLLPPESTRLSFCKPSLLNNHNHSQRGLEMHLFFPLKDQLCVAKSLRKFSTVFARMAKATLQVQ